MQKKYVMQNQPWRKFPTIGIKKLMCWRPDTVALHETQKYQKSPEQLIRNVPFVILNREIALD